MPSADQSGNLGGRDWANACASRLVNAREHARRVNDRGSHVWRACPNGACSARCSADETTVSCAVLAETAGSTGQRNDTGRHGQPTTSRHRSANALRKWAPRKRSVTAADSYSAPPYTV
jgi:hypothetical protein